MYSVSGANMWGRYTSHFTDHFYKMNGEFVYPHQPTFYDTRHIFYLEAAIEELYTFYERISYIAYLFLHPFHLMQNLYHSTSFWSGRPSTSLN